MRKEGRMASSFLCGIRFYHGVRFSNLTQLGSQTQEDKRFENPRVSVLRNRHHFSDKAGFTFLKQLKLIILFLFFFTQNLQAQNLSFVEYLNLVKQNHPLIKQANLLPADAQAEILQAKGFFDPKLSSDFERKAFQGKDYYNRWNSNLKIPTWYGPDFKVGYEQNTGNFLQSEESPRLMYAGVSIPLGQGLLIDARRNTLKQANLGSQLADAEKVKIINKAILSAAKEYWEWYLAYQQLRLTEEGQRLADLRFRGTKARANIGEQAAIDSVEAKITLQDRQVMLEQARVEWQNARLALSNFLWNDKEMPMELDEKITPEIEKMPLVNETTLQELLVKAKSQHPEILKVSTKLEQLSIEERFRKEMLKPQVNLDFTLLGKTFNADPILPYSDAFRWANQKVGLSLQMPLLFRKERGKLQQIRIKQSQNLLDKTLIIRTIMNDVYASYNEVKNFERQLKIQEDAVKNQEILLRGEQRKFDIGESTLFLLNSRENKLIEMRIKVEALKTKYQKSLAQLAYSAGLTEL
jgi:outer membrane protein